MAWTVPVKIADRKRAYLDRLTWNGPACYELEIYHPETRQRQIVYVGETVNEAARMKAYATHGSHLAYDIDWHLRRGWVLRYRARAAKSKKAAVKMQNNLLARYDYDWNISRNC